MRELLNFIMRSLSIVIVSSIMLQPFSFVAYAQTTSNLSAIDILQVEEYQDGAKLRFTPLAEGMMITARVDQSGKGDFLTIQSALAEVKSGVIAISNGTYQEHDLLVSDNVIIRGGYDNRTWQKTPDGVTTISGSAHKPAVILQRASGIQNVVIREASTGIRVAYGPATISQVSVISTKQALEISPYAHVRIAHSNFIKNEAVILGHSNSKVFAIKNIFQNNTQTVKAPVDNLSFIKDSVFFPQKTTLQNVRDENNTVSTVTPLANAELQFPSEAGGTVVNQSVDFSRLNDSKPTTFPGPVLQASTGINAVHIYYQLSLDDELRLVDRSNFSNVVFDTTGEERNFSGWIAIPRTTELAMMIDTNGDDNLPLQAGIDKTALIPTPAYQGPSNQGMMSTSDEAFLFYRMPNSIAGERTLGQDQKEKVLQIDTPKILAGEEWVKGSDLDTTNTASVSSYKGFLSKVLLQKDSGSLRVANESFVTKRPTTSDTRFFSLISDFVSFARPPLLAHDSCELASNCQLEVQGLRKFLPLAIFPLREEHDAVENTRGLYNNEGWNAPIGTNAHMKVTLPEALTHFSVAWNLQPFDTIINQPAHIITFSQKEAASGESNQISLFMNSESNIVVRSVDAQGIGNTHITSGLSWEPGRKYRLTLEINDNKVTLVRSDGISLWQASGKFQDITYLHLGKMSGPEGFLPMVMSDIVVWNNLESIHTFSSLNSRELASSLNSGEESIAGSLQLNSANICQENSITIKDGDRDFAVISGQRNGNNCTLSLHSFLTDRAQNSVPVTELGKDFVLIWQWNPLSAQGGIYLLNDSQILLGTLTEFGSKPISNAFGNRNLRVILAQNAVFADIRYYLLKLPTVENLARLIGVERFEVLYSDTERAVHTGVATKLAISVQEARRAENPEKVVPRLEKGKRYFFAVRAILENGSSTETTHSKDLLITGKNRESPLEAASDPQQNLPTTLALQNNGLYHTAMAQESEERSAATSAEVGSVLPGHLGETLLLNNASSENSGMFAWSLGKDLSVSSNRSPQHIYTIPGEYIVSQIRTLNDGNVLKQFGLVAIGHQSSDRPRISASTWTSSSTNPESPWTNKQNARKIPALIGVNEPFYLLANASDVAGSSDDAYTWKYSVDWGDGSSDGTEAVKNAFNKTRLAGSQKEETPLTHRYTRPGIYTIVSQVTDGEGHTGAFENTVIVSNPEIYPQRITSLPGISRLISISGGTAPYTLRLTDGSEQTLAAKQRTFSLPIIEAGTVTVRDRFNNSSTLEISLASNITENFAEVYLPEERAVRVIPDAAKTGEIVEVKSHGEEHLSLKTQNLLFHFGDTLPSYLVSELPTLEGSLTFDTASKKRTTPFLNIGLYPAILTNLTAKGKELKKAFSLDIGRARFGAQSTAGIITGTIAPGLKSIPDSVELWHRSSASTQLASLTPNTQGRFIYFLPSTIDPEGVISMRVKDQQGNSTNFVQNIRYSLKDRPEKLFGILETSTSSPLFATTGTLASNAEKPTFFGLDSKKEQKLLRVASDNPHDYPIVANASAGWVVESATVLEEGKHTFTILNEKEEPIANYPFIIDRTAPQKPQIIHASWSELQGKTEPFAYIGVIASGNTHEEQYVQADSGGSFHINFTNSFSQYVLAAADDAGNISSVVQISQAEWETPERLSLWQKIRSYVLFSFLILLAATGIGYARKTKI